MLSKKIFRSINMSYSVNFAKVNKKPSYAMMFFYLIISMFKGTNYRIDLFRAFKVSKLLPDQNNFQPSIHLPKIELLINTTKKDFVFLNRVVNKAVANSVNIIEKISVVVPEGEISACKELLQNNVNSSLICIESENKLISESMRNKIRQYFPHRYGWVLQQFLTIQKVLDSKYSGVLQVNSDTLLLKPTVWLDENMKQPLYVSYEYHRPYYVLLNKLDKRFPINTNSHISHHMLFQPLLMRKIFDEIGYYNSDDLLNAVLANFNQKDQSAICIEYELYALGIIHILGTEAKVSKSGNVNLRIHQIPEKLDIFLDNLASNYNSVSFHSY